MPDISSTVLSDCILVFDPAGERFVFISSNVSCILGYTAADFYGEPGLLFDMISPDYRDKVKEQVNALGEGDWIDLHYPVITPAGQQKWVHDRKNLAAGAKAGAAVLLSTIKDYNPGSTGQKDEALLREQFLNSLIDSQTNFMIRFDTAGCFTFANRQFLKMVGYKKNELIGKHFSLITIPEELDMCNKAFVNCVSHPGKVIKIAHKKLDKSGVLHDTEWEFVSVTNELGLVVAVQGIGHDITQKLIIEKEIKATAQKLDALIESINDYFFILDKEWKFVRVNKAFETVCCKSREELIGFSAWDIFPVALGSNFERAYREAVAENKSIRFTEHIQPENVWFDTTVYPSPEGLTVFLKDVTEEKRAQEEVAWTKNSLEALINNTEDQIWSVDTETRYVYMNRAYRTQIAQLTGHEPQKGGYSYLHTGYSKEIIDAWVKYYARALAGERYTIINESIDPNTQKLLSFEISFNPIYKVKGDITGVGCFARNITAWLETEKAIVDQNERLRHIASVTSHELRRPVASLLGLINLMDRHNFFNPDNKEIIEHLLTVGNEIDEVIRVIVDKTFMGDQFKDKYQSP